MDLSKRAHLNRRGWVAAVAIGAAVIAAAVIPALEVGNGDSADAAHPAKAPQATHLTATQIVDHAMAMAKACGDPQPASVNYVETTRGAADKLIDGTSMGDAEPGPDTPVALVVMTGDFTVVLHPPESQKDKGVVTAHQINAVFDESTGDRLGWGETPTPHDFGLASLGTVHSVALPR